MKRAERLELVAEEIITNTHRKVDDMSGTSELTWEGTVTDTQRAEQAQESPT